MEPTARALADLFAALDRLGRAHARSAEDDRRMGVAEVAGHVAHVAGQFPAPVLTADTAVPPRAVAAAIAQALFSAPHTSRTLAVASTAGELPVVRATDGLGVELGLDPTEMEALRATTDRRVADALQQIRALQWLWRRAGNPRTDPSGLAALLFPHRADLPVARFANHGSRLYAVVPMARPCPPEALYLPWLPDAPTWTAPPHGTFNARLVDDGTVRALGRAVGTTPEAARTLLARMVCVVPEGEETTFFRHDRWRSEGWAALTGLADPVPGGGWLTAPAGTDELLPDGLLARTDDGGLAVQGARRAFDRAARARVTVLLHGLYAELCARAMQRQGIPPSGQPVLYDLAPYIQRALRPLLDGCGRADIHRHIADRHGVSVDIARAAMARLGETWTDLARASWGGAPGPDRPVTIQGLLAAHLARVQSSVERLRRMPSDPRADHHRVLLLFLAHHMVDAPIGRLWRPVDGAVPDPEDVVGRWFWPLWQRSLDASGLGPDSPDEEDETAELSIDP